MRRPLTACFGNLTASTCDAEILPAKRQILPIVCRSFIRPIFAFSSTTVVARYSMQGLRHRRVAALHGPTAQGLYTYLRTVGGTLPANRNKASSTRSRKAVAPSSYLNGSSLARPLARSGQMQGRESRTRNEKGREDPKRLAKASKRLGQNSPSGYIPYFGECVV